MASRKRHLKPQPATRRKNPKAFLLPMPREAADVLALEARVGFERARCGEASREICNGLVRVVLFTRFVTELDHGLLAKAFLDDLVRKIGQALLSADRTGDWRVPGSLIDDLLIVVNEYDRQLRETRLGIISAAGDRLERFIGADLLSALSR